MSLNGVSGDPAAVQCATTSATINIIDNDQPTLVVSASGQTISRSEGDSYSFTVFFQGTPTSNVTLNVIPSSLDLDLGAGPGQPIALTFTNANATTPQPVTVTAVDDGDVNGDRAVTVRFTTVSSHAAFNDLIVPPPPAAPVNLTDVVGSLSNSFRDLGNQDSAFAGYAGPDTLGGIGYGQTGSLCEPRRLAAVPGPGLLRSESVRLEYQHHGLRQEWIGDRHGDPGNG